MKNAIKMTAILLLIIITAIFFSGCGETHDAESTVGSMLEQLKGGNLAQAKKYTYNKGKSPEVSIAEGPLSRIHKAYCNTLEYSIVSSKKKANGSVEVKAEIKFVNMQPVISALGKNLVDYILNNPEIGNDNDKLLQKIADLLEKELSGDKLQKHTKNYNFTVEKKAKEWKITDDEGFTEEFAQNFSQAWQGFASSIQSAD